MQKGEGYLESSSSQRPGPTFDPPVYRQRYQRVKEIVNTYKAKKVLDFGCAEGKMLRFLINAETSVEELVGVDIDGDLLKGSVFRIKPLTSDYLIPRPAPLTVSLYQGSISQADDRFCNFDVVACVEIVEHLIPEHLEAMPTVLLGQLSPAVAIVTTPNVEFNVLFPDLTGYRHWDHKFEWTRAEFEEWANTQAERYGYSVTFEGIGHGPLETDYLGCCSQMALFLRADTEQKHGDTEQFGQPYNMIAEVAHPYRKCTLTDEEKIVIEVERLLWFLSQPTSYYDEDAEEEEDGDTKAFTMERLFEMPSLKRLCGSIDKLRTVVQSSKLELTEDGNSVLYVCQSEWSSDSETETEWDTANTSAEHDACTSEALNIESTKQENWDDDDGDDVDAGVKDNWDDTDNATDDNNDDDGGGDVGNGGGSSGSGDGGNDDGGGGDGSDGGGDGGGSGDDNDGGGNDDDGGGNDDSGGRDRGCGSSGDNDGGDDDDSGGGSSGNDWVKDNLDDIDNANDDNNDDDSVHDGVQDVLKGNTKIKACGTSDLNVGKSKNGKESDIQRTMNKSDIDNDSSHSEDDKITDSTGKHSCWTSDPNAGKYWNGMERDSPEAVEPTDTRHPSDEGFHTCLTYDWLSTAYNDNDDECEWDCVTGEEGDGLPWIGSGGNADNLGQSPSE